MNGPSSYYPDGGRKDAQALSDEVDRLIRDTVNLNRFVDDPSNLINEIAGHLRKFGENFKKANKIIENNDLRDPIQIPPEFTPETYDRGRDIGVDLDPEREFIPPPDRGSIMQPTAYPGVLDLAGRGVKAGGISYWPSNVVETAKQDPMTMFSFPSVDQRPRLLAPSRAPFGWIFPRVQSPSSSNGEASDW